MSDTRRKHPRPRERKSAPPRLCSECRVRAVLVGTQCPECKAARRHLRDVHQDRPVEGERRVRCLGPSDREHYFNSPGPGVRVCGRCRDRQRALRVSPLCHKVTRDPSGDRP